MKGFQFAAYLVILSTADPTIFVLGAKAQEPCKLADIGQGTVASVRDGRMLLLADGREVRLAAIEVTDSSRDALQSLVDNRDLRLMRLGLDQDRYGRVVAFVHVGDRQQSIQEMLVEQGQTRVAARIGAFRTSCTRGTARSLARPQFRPFTAGKSCPNCRRTGPICIG
jgi:endonuclease YncB( thermonuclease family)